MTPKDRLGGMGFPGMQPDPNAMKKVFNTGLKQGIILGFAIGVVVMELILHIWSIV